MSRWSRGWEGGYYVNDFNLFGVFVIPMLYVVFQWLRERVSRKPAAPKPAPAAEAAH